VVLGLIIACEVAFWVAVLGGLAARYVANRPRLGLVLLFAAPAVDVVLLLLVAVDLLGGGTASWHHGLASLYVGISVAYGHRMIAWADAKFATRFRGAAPRPKLAGAAYTVACWKDAARTLLAVAISGAILGGLILIVGAPARTEELRGFFPLLGVILGIDVLWAVSYTVWPKKAAATANG
jgi:hypothetical protein